MFIIRIKELQALTTLGVYDWEREAKRLVVLNVELHVAADKAGLSDDMRDSVDYALIEGHIVARLEESSYQLIERLVADIGRSILALDERIVKVALEADKPGALRQARSVSVWAEFSR